MKRSRYTYFFDIDKEYVGYSYLSDDYAAFPLENKERIEEILKYPDEIITNTDADIYRELCSKKCLITDDFDEYKFLMRLHRQFIHRTDLLSLTIVPTMACNCRCTYCYELHPSLKKSRMSREVINNLKNYIAGNIKNLNLLNIEWFGGEPLLCMDIIKEISEFCINLCDKENVLFGTNMTSNVVLLNKKNAQIITECGIHDVQITLDGSKENHDKTRVTVGGKPTFDIIYNNIINYLDSDEKNRVALRVHVSSNAKEEDIEGIIEILSLFEDKYRKKITPYPHVIFGACSEEWSRKGGQIVEETVDRIYIITSRIHKDAISLGYDSGLHLKEAFSRCACPADRDKYWVVRPDGYLNKCTVGIEKERAQAKLTKNGIELFPERFFKTMTKEFSAKLYEHCQDCEYLPFCWQGCIYKHYQNPDIDSYIQTQCLKNKEDWMIRRKIDTLKYCYIKEKRER